MIFTGCMPVLIFAQILIYMIVLFEKYMCKEERHCQSLKRDITLHLSMILKKANLLNFFFWSLSEKAKTISNEGNQETTVPFLDFSSVFDV